MPVEIEAPSRPRGAEEPAMSSIEEKPSQLSLEQKRALVARLLREKAGDRRPTTAFVHRMFEEQAARVPAAVALATDGESLTYRELDARANRLAKRLRSNGVGPEVLVGLCVGRSTSMVVALLAVLKAGGA